MNVRDMDPATLRALAAEMDDEAAYRAAAVRGDQLAKARVEWLVQRLTGLAKTYRKRATMAEKAKGVASHG